MLCVLCGLLQRRAPEVVPDPRVYPLPPQIQSRDSREPGTQTGYALQQGRSLDLGAGVWNPIGASWCVLQDYVVQAGSLTVAVSG